MGEVDKETAIPVAGRAVEIVEPDKPYDRVWWSLSATCRPGAGQSDAVVSVSWTPCRVLRDGTVELAPESQRRGKTISSLFGPRGELTPLGKALVNVIKLIVG